MGVPKVGVREEECKLNYLGKGKGKRMVGADICSGMSRPTGRNELAPIKELKGTEE